MNPSAARHLAQIDPVLAQLMARVGPLRFQPRRLSPFQSLVQAIIFQQLSGKAAETILRRFITQCGGSRFPTPGQVLAATAEQLRAAGLSRAKASYVRDVAEQTMAGRLPSLDESDALSDAELIERLTIIKGVGRWTAEMFLIFNLGRPDVLPVHDLGVRRGFQILHRKRALPAPLHLERHGRRWAPHRSTAALYLWRALDIAPGESW